MSDVLLIFPPYGYLHKPAEAIAPPLGLAYISSFLKANGISVRLVDCTPSGMGVNELEKVVREEKPAIVGISSTTPLIKKAYLIAGEVKSVDPSIVVVLGGPHATALSDPILRESKVIDIVVRGEGELTMLELSQELQKKHPNLAQVRGICYREGDNIRVTEARPLIEDLDSLPFPDRESLPIYAYRPSIKWYNRMPFTTMFTSRGCPFGCIFCDSRLTFGRRARYRSAENVVQEMRTLIDEYGVKEIIFYDDIFTLKKERVQQICDLILKMGLDITWGCLSRVDTIDEPLLRKMKEAGCHMISFGLESGSDEILQIIGKGITSEQSRRALELTKKVGIDTTGTFVIGVPGETKETIIHTIDFAEEVNPTFAEFFRIVPFPGTQLYHLISEQGHPSAVNWEDFVEGASLPLLDIETLEKTEAQRLVKQAYRHFYLRPSKIWELLRAISSIHKVKGYIRALTTFFKLG